MFLTLSSLREVHQPCDQLHGPSLDPLQQLLILPILGLSGLDAVLKMGLHEDRVKQDIQL